MFTDYKYKSVLNALFNLGQHIKRSAQRFFKTCQRCKRENGAPTCEFVGCRDNSEISEIICSEVESICLITLFCGNVVNVVFTKMMFR